MTTSILDKFKGALVGCAVGDAMGAPLKGMSPDEIRRKHGRVTGFLDGGSGKGMITDDTQMMVVVAQALVESGRFDLEHTATKLGGWMKYSDMGVKEARKPREACVEACRNLYGGIDPLESGVPSVCCGAATRVCPVGLRYYDEPDSLARAAADQARITHSDPGAMAGAVAVAFAVAEGIKNDGCLDPPRLIEAVGEAVRPIDGIMADRIGGLSNWIEADTVEGLGYTGNGSEVSQAVPAALLSFSRTPHDFNKTVQTAVNAGGEADSIGAMAGAISGAFNGIGAVREDLKNEVEGRAYLESLAYRLYTLTPAYRPRSGWTT